MTDAKQAEWQRAAEEAYVRETGMRPAQEDSLPIRLYCQGRAAEHAANSEEMARLTSVVDRLMGETRGYTTLIVEADRLRSALKAADKSLASIEAAPGTCVCGRADDAREARAAIRLTLGDES